jgi:hypothetical protein
MLKKIILLMVVFLSIPFTSFGADGSFIMDVKPLAVLASSDIDGFYLYRGESGAYYSYQERIEIEGTGSFLPSLNLGVGIDTQVARLNTTVGLCYLWNNAFAGYLPLLQTEAKFKLGKAITLGPRIGLVFSENLHFHNIDDNEVWLSAADTVQGMLYGLDFTAGGKRVAFHLSLDYFALDPYEVHINPDSDWQPSASELDLSGGVINIGVTINF